MKRTFALLLVFLSVNAWAQLDKIHYIPPFYASDSVGTVYKDVGDLYIALSTQESLPFTVSIYRGETLFQEVIISKSTPQLIYLGRGYSTSDNPTGVVNEEGRNRTLKDEGYMLSADKPFFSATYHRSGAQGDVLTCKGEMALGNEFYSGHIHAYLSNVSRKSIFVSVMATFDNTQITFSNPRVRWQGQGANTFTITLNKNESYVLGTSFSYIGQSGYDVNDYNGTKITSTKPIAVNSGSWCSSASPAGSQDMGFDQLVPQSFVGEDYVVVEGYGTPNGEQIIVVATRPNTELYVNDTLEYTFAQAGEYYTIKQDEYSDANNLAIKASKKVYVYQTLSGKRSDVSVGLCFIPPLSCLSNREINVSYANQIGNPMLNLIAEVGSDITINGMPLQKTPEAVVGNPDWVTYRLENSDVLNYNPQGDNFEIVSTQAINAALAFQDGAIGGAGFFSGFGVSPQLLAAPDVEGTAACYPHNATLNADGYDSYIWYYNNEIIPGENEATLVPTKTGQYRVSGFTSCGVTKASEPFILKTCMTLDGGGRITEGADPQPIYVHLGLPAEEDVEYWYRIVPQTATEGYDYKALTGIGIIEAGQTTDSLFVEIIDDKLYEGGDEQFQFEVYYASNATVQNPTLDYVIEDAAVSPPIVNVNNNVLYREGDGNSLVLFEHNYISGVPGSFDYYTVDYENLPAEDQFYTPVSGTYTINPGDTYGSIAIPLIDNDELNPMRAFYLIFKNYQHITLNYDSVKVVVMDDDSPSACLDIMAEKTTYEESDGQIYYQVKLNKPQAVIVQCDMRFSYNTTDVSDFDEQPIFIQKLTFQPGDTVKSFSISIIDDDLVESDELFTVNLEEAENAYVCSNGVNFTIKNNDYIPLLFDDNYSCLEDKSLNGNVMDNDVVKGDTPVFVYFTPPANGLFTGDSTGQFFYQPAADFSGAVFFNYGVRDSSGDSVSARVQVMVQQVNDVPIAYHDTVFTDEDIPFDIYPLANDKDVDKTGLSIEAVDDNDLGEVNMYRQYLHYIPHKNDYGTDILSYAIQDNEGDPAYAKIVVYIRSVNDVPIAHDDVFQMNEDGGSIILDLLLNDEDQDRSGLTLLSLSDIVGGEAIIQNNRVNFTPYPNFWGEASFSYVMRDGEMDSAEAQVSINVLGANDWPRAIDDYFQIDEDNVLQLNMLENDIDDDQRGLSIMRVDSARHGRVFSANNQWYYQPKVNFYGQDSLRYFIEDWNNDADNAWVSILVRSINEAPIAVNDTFNLLEDAALQFDALANDRDPDASGLSFVTIENLLHGTVTFAQGLFTYQPELDYFGDHYFDYIIKDGEQDFDTARVVLSIQAVNEQPKAVDDIVQLDEDHFIEIPLLANDYDADKGGLSIDQLTSTSHANLAWRNDTLIYTPQPNDCGYDTLHYIISDAQDDKDEANIYITVNCINDAPRAVNDTLVATEDVRTQFYPLNNDLDPDRGGISIVMIGAPEHGAIDVTDNGYFYTSALNYNGNDSLVYIIKDAENDKDTATIYITVLASNDYPVANNDNYHVNEDLVLRIAPLRNDTDVEDGRPMRLIMHQLPQLGTYQVKDSIITYQGFSNRWGHDTLSYVALDRYGAISDIAYVYITIDSVNEAPISTDFSRMLNEDGQDTIDVLLTAQDPDFSGLSLQATSQGKHGAAFIIDQLLIYRPTLNYYGLDTLTYTIIDGEGDSSVSSLYLSVLPVNDAPLAYADEVHAEEDIPLIFSPLSNDMDIEDEVLHFIEIVSYPSYGNLLVKGDSLYYNSMLNWWGKDTLRYKTKDADGAYSNVASVFIQVDSVNEAPIVNELFVNVSEDITDTIDVLTFAQSPDFSPLSLVDYLYHPNAMPKHGTFSINNNTIHYLSHLNYYGLDTMMYYVADGEGDIDSALLRVNVLSVNDAPVAYPDTFRFVQGIGEEDKFTVLPVYLNDTDIDEEPVQGRVLIDSLPLHGELMFSQDKRSIIYFPDSAFTGHDSLSYRLQDTLSAISEVAWVYIETDSFNFVPRAVNDTIFVLEDGEVTFDPMANDWDIHNDSLWPTVTSLMPSNGLFDRTATQRGVVHLKDDHHWTYEPERNFYGRDSFYYFANDPKGGITRAKVIINVAAVNDAPSVSMKYLNLLYPENAAWRNVLFDTKIVDVDDVVMRGAILSVHGETMKDCQLTLGELDYLDRVDYTPTTMTMYFKDSIMPIQTWEQVLNTVRYRNDSDNDSSSRAFHLCVFDTATLLSDTLIWHLNSLSENDPPRLLQLPQLDGSFLPDSILSCSTGQWEDPDGEISYRYQWWITWSDGSQKMLSDTSHLLTVSPDMQEAQSIRCQVVAYNATNPPVYADAVYTDSLKPENHYPDALVLNAETLYRTHRDGTWLGVLNGFDRDSTQSLSYELVSSQDSFYLQGDSLFLAIDAYYFDTPIVDVRIRVVDNARVPLSKVFTVELYPINDLMPLFRGGKPTRDSVGGDTVVFSFKTDKPGFAHYVIFSAEEVLDGLSDSSLLWTNDSLLFNADEMNSIGIGNLDSETNYFFAIQLVDTSSRYASNTYFAPFRTLDVSGPVLSAPQQVLSSWDAIQLQLSISEPGQLFYRLRENDTTYFNDTSYADTMLVDTGDVVITSDLLRHTFRFDSLRSQMRYNLYVYAVDTLGNWSEMWYPLNTKDSIAPLFRYNYPLLLDFSESQIRYQVQASESVQLLLRLGTNYDVVDSFIGEYTLDLYEGEEFLNENVVHTLRTSEIEIDGIYHLDFIMVDSAGNRSEVKSIDFQYPEPFNVSLKKSVLACGEDIELAELTELANYSLYNMSGTVIQSGLVKPELLTIDIPTLKEGVYIIRFYNEFGDVSFSFLQKGKF